MKQSNTISLFSILLFCALTACGLGSNNERKKIFYINSYHEGYPSSDDITEGILETIKEEHITLKVFFMDTKLNPEEDKVKVKVKEALKQVEKFSPDLVIASDDNAVKYIVKPHLKDIPVVFCGVNWSADQYELGDNVTGMLEVLPLRECLQLIMHEYPEARRLTVLSENSTSERKNTELLDTLYKHLGMTVEYRLVNDFEQWKQAYLDASNNASLLYLSTNGAVRDWDREEAIDFIRKNIRIPSVTCDDFMMDYCVFGLTKMAKEQGEWAAKTAIQIMNGRAPASIPYTSNRQTHSYLNRDLANRVGFDIKEPPAGQFTVINP